MKKIEPRAKTLSSDKMLSSSVISGAVPFMTGFLAATIVQEIVFKSKKHKENTSCDVNFAQNDTVKRTKYRQKDDNCEYFSSFDMKVGLGDV